MISFIVPAHDEAQRLGATLAALHAAARDCAQRYEIIVVDDASTDATADIATGGGARVLRVDHRHIAATRNAGAGAALGDIFVFVDADTRIDAAVLRAALAALAAGAAGGGATLRLSGRLRGDQRVLAALAVWTLRLARLAPGCFIFCTRDAFTAAGGFDERYFAGEDIAISRALARQGRFVVLREPVWSSARKMHTFSATEHLRLMLRLAWRGRGLLRSREGLDMWYGRRRESRDD